MIAKNFLLLKKLQESLDYNRLNAYGLIPFNKERYLSFDAQRIASYFEWSVKKQIINAIKDMANAKKLESFWKRAITRFAEEHPFDARYAYNTIMNVWTKDKYRQESSEEWYAVKDYIGFYSFKNSSAKEIITEEEIVKSAMNQLAKEKGYEEAYRLLTENREIELIKYQYNRTNTGTVSNSSFSTYYHYDMEISIFGVNLSFDDVHSDYYSGGWN